MSNPSAVNRTTHNVPDADVLAVRSLVGALVLGNVVGSVKDTAKALERAVHAS